MNCCVCCFHVQPFGKLLLLRGAVADAHGWFVSGCCRAFAVGERERASEVHRTHEVSCKSAAASHPMRIECQKTARKTKMPLKPRKNHAACPRPIAARQVLSIQIVGRKPQALRRCAVQAAPQPLFRVDLQLEHLRQLRGRKGEAEQGPQTGREQPHAPVAGRERGPHVSAPGARPLFAGNSGQGVCHEWM